MFKLYILESSNYNFILTMEGGTVKKYRNTVKQIDEVNDCNVFQKDSDKFVQVEAEAGAAKNSANDARRLPKKKIDKKQTQCGIRTSDFLKNSV